MGVKQTFQSVITPKDKITPTMIGNEIINQTTRYDINDLTKLKLHKLIYIVSVVYIKVYNKPIFREKFKAWRHGQIIESINHIDKGIKGHYRSSDVLLIPSGIGVVRDDNVKWIVNKVLEEHGTKRIWDLVQMLNQEGCAWERTFYDKELTEIPYEYMVEEEFI